MRAVLLGIAAGACAAALACRAHPPPLHPAGSDGDEGHGLLGNASVQLLTGANREVEPDDSEPGERRDDDEDEDLAAAAIVDEADASQAFGGGAYGGKNYAGFVVRPWPVAAPNREPAYEPQPGLAGALEGTISWRGAVPAKLTTACGAIAPLRVTPERRLPGVIVFIESVRVGRAMEVSEARPLSVGGTVVKRGCALLPAAQVAAPLPVAIEVHADARAAQLRVTRIGSQRVPQVVELALQPAAHRGVSLERGSARVEAADGTLAAAHVLGLTTPYYAVTDDRGHYRIDELAPGTYVLSVWRAPVPTLMGGKLVYGVPVVTTRRVTVPRGAKPGRADVTLGGEP